MKILYVCKSLPEDYKGGIQTHTWELSKNMARLGDEVYILAGGSIKRGYEQQKLEDRTIIRLPFFPARFMPIFPKFFDELSFNYFARKWLKKHAKEYDIIHLQGRSGYFFPFHKSAPHSRIVVTFHGVTKVEYQYTTYKWWNPQKWDAFFHQTAATFFEKRIWKKADAIIVVSEAIKKLLIQTYQDTTTCIHLIPNGVDTDSFLSSKIHEKTSIIKDETQFLTFIGRLESVKGLLKLPSIVEHLNPNIQLLIIGEGSMRGHLEKEIEARGIQHRFLFTGAISAEEIKGWLKQSYALLLPSEHEPQGIVLLEANSSGIPVIASDIGGINEVVKHGENGLLVDPNRPEAYAEAINYMYDHPQAAKKMGSWGREWVKSFFSWEVITKETRTVYQQLRS